MSTHIVYNRPISGYLSITANEFEGNVKPYLLKWLCIKKVKELTLHYNETNLY